MKRISNRQAVANMAKLAEMQALVPAVMTRRLSELSGLSPWQSAFAWNRWAMEKAFAFSLVGVELMQAMSQQWLAQALGGGSASAWSTAHAAQRALGPLHKRVKRNSRRRRG